MTHTVSDTALASLTEKEKECLRRHLRHQTAKEMARDLGVSHHAIEKRLKMARTKLGVTSSLQAAQILGEAEGYDRTAYQPSDLSDALADPARTGFSITKRGVLFMTIATALAAALLVQAGGNPYAQPDPNGQKIVTMDGDQVHYAKASPERIRGWLKSVFDRTDGNDDGFIDRSEAPASYPHQDGDAMIVLTGEEAKTAFIDQYDGNDDGRISAGEYVEAAFPAFEDRGVPLLPGDWIARR